MPAGPVLDPRAVIDGDRERWITKRLLGYCYRKTGDIIRAKELAQQAIVLVLEARGWHAWSADPAKTPRQSLLDHLCNVARSTAKDENKSAAAWREVPLRMSRDPEGGDAYVHEEPDPAPTIEMASIGEGEHLRWMRLAERVVARLDAQARALLALEEEGVHGAAEQAARVGCSEGDVYNARKRIARVRDAVLAEERAAREKEGGPQ